MESALTRRHGHLANLRLVTVVVTVVLAWLVFGRHALPAAGLLAPVGVFVALALAHDRVLQTRARARRAVTFYERGLARIGDKWAGTANDGNRFQPADHPYAADLDLFGRGSLFELLSTARLHAGEQRLADWLLAPADPATIRARQAAVAELRPGLDLRERLALAGDDVPGWLDTSLLASWGQAPAVLTGIAPRLVAFALGLANVTTLAAAFLSTLSSAWFALSATASIAFTLWWRRRVSHVIASANAPAHHLNLLAEVLRVVEQAGGSAPALAAIATRLTPGGQPASHRVHELRRLVNLLESRGNQFFAPIAALLLWGAQCAWAIDAWRQRHGAQLGDWIGAVGDFEALSSLATYAYEHPGDPFPEVLDTGAVFEGTALAHPLIAAARAVPNDVRLDDTMRVLVVSGSNMSGKSTLLRTVGAAAVMAQAGAPVRGTRLRLSPLAVGATLRVQDSLVEGRSRFYAEITRLRAIVDLTAETRRVLFLLDELLAGTNSHDRRVGAASVVGGLVDRGAIGLLTTHDLALSDLVSTLGVGAANVHFSDTFERGEIHFDYRMQAGVVQTSNALELMKAIGLIPAD